jgi:bis(5'-nucleosidyl)-tetraphosphatase
MIKGALVIIFRIKGEKSEFLIIENKETGNITFVGGACENDESTKQAAEREMKEELGLNSDQYDLVEIEFKYEFVFDDKKKERVGQEAEYQVYLNDLTDFFGEIIKTDDVKSFEWVSEEEVMKKLTFEEHKSIFTKAIVGQLA